jgi:hypothetical protein
MAGDRGANFHSPAAGLEKELVQARIMTAQRSTVYLLPEIAGPDNIGVKHPDAIVDGHLMGPARCQRGNGMPEARPAPHKKTGKGGPLITNARTRRRRGVEPHKSLNTCTKLPRIHTKSYMEFGIGIYGVWYRYLWSLVSVSMEFGIGIAGKPDRNQLYYMKLRDLFLGREL